MDMGVWGKNFHAGFLYQFEGSSGHSRKIILEKPSESRDDTICSMRILERPGERIESRHQGT